MMAPDLGKVLNAIVPLFKNRKRGHRQNKGLVEAEQGLCLSTLKMWFIVRLLYVILTSLSSFQQRASQIPVHSWSIGTEGEYFSSILVFGPGS